MRNDKALFALHKYFISANQMRQDFDELLAKSASAPRGLDVRLVKLNIYMSYWYAGVYVVIEGWKRLHLADREIELQLQDEARVHLLEEFRHYVYHYHADYFDKRYKDLINRGAEIVPWIRILWKSFGRYFLQELPRVPKGALSDSK